VDIECIDATTVARTLRRVLAGHIPADEPLLTLRAVGMVGSADGARPAHSTLALALTAHICDVVAQMLDRARGPCSAATATEDGPEAATAGLVADFAAGNRQREAWSSVYYHYLAPYDFQVKQIAALVRPREPNARRFVGRRLHDGVELLARALRDSERALAESALDTGTRPRPPFRLPRVHDMPRWHSALVGREAEAGAIAEALSPGSVVTLVGPPGVGKSRLAAHVTGLVADRFPDGVALMDLTRISDWSAVAEWMGHALGLPTDANRSMADTILAGAGCRPMIVLLDNCERLLDPCAALADELLGRCPDMAVIATSREPLGVYCERVMRLAGLPAPAPDEAPTAEALGRYAAALLFADRAKRADATFRLTEDTAPAVASICRRLEGNPLAIELAATRVGVIPLPALAERIDEALLTASTTPQHPGRGAETLRETVLRSYRPLSPAQQELFCRLAAFEAPWTVEAAAAVCTPTGMPASEVFGHLVTMAAKSLIAPADCGSELRYRLVEPVRQVARELFRSCGCLVPTRDLHLAYFLRRVEAAASAEDGDAWARWWRDIAAERDDVLAALAWSEERSDLRSTVRLVAALAGTGFSVVLRAQIRRALAPCLAPESVAVDPSLADLARSTLVVLERGAPAPGAAAMGGKPGDED